MRTIEEAAKVNCEYNPDRLRQYDEYFIDAFKSGAEFVQHWTPTKEGLPEKNGWYLCIRMPTYLPYSEYIIAGVNYNTFTHWMPLPEPPKD